MRKSRKLRKQNTQVGERRITMSATEVLRVEGLTKIYGRELKLGNIRKFGRKVTGAEEVTFGIRKGEIFGFLGPNGSGKTTTIRSILDYLRIQSGIITVFGLDHHQDALAIRKRISYVSEDLALYENFTGEELIEYFHKFRPVNREFLKKLKSIFRVDLTLKIKALSSGNRQQVGLIVALASKPELLILDEPTSGLDPLMAANFHNILKVLKKEEITTFLSSHDLAEVQTVCDRVGIIKDGRMILVENVEDLRSKSLQDVKIKFASSTIPSKEEFKALDSVIYVEKTNETTFTLKIKEDVNEILKLLTKYQIERLTIEEATLEEIFLQFYE